jgi:hypothetical protein
MIFRQAHRGEPVSLILCIGGLRLPLFDMYIGCREVFLFAFMQGTARSARQFGLLFYAGNKRRYLR